MSLKLIVANWEPPAETDKRLLNSHIFWQPLLTEGDSPYRRDFKPTAMRGLLPYMFLVDVLRNPCDFRFRLTGSEFKDGSGQDLTGRLISEAFPPDFYKEVQQEWGLVVETRQPKWGRGRLWVKERDYVTWEGVVMPFQNDNSEIHQLLGAAVFHLDEA